MLLARGDVQDRAFGVTLAALARKYRTAQLTVLTNGVTYEVVFRDGTIVAARSPDPDDRLSRIALARGWITPDTCRVIEQVCASSPTRDDLDVVTVLGELSAETALLLQRRAIAQRAARLIGLDAGAYALSADVRIPVREGTETHIGGVIFQGALLHVSHERLEDIISRLGSRFELTPANVDELEYLGFGKAEAPIVRALLEGVTFDRLVQLRGIEAPHAYAAVYALVACGLAVASPRLARGTQNPIGHMTPATARPLAVVERAPAVAQPAESVVDRATDASAAAAAFERGELALQAQRISDAIVELEYAVGLAPTEKRYTTALAWAKFCGATDKADAAKEARKVLLRVAGYHDGPIEAHYYLGLIERMLDRPVRAEEHFREVLDRMPNHVEAATELRFLARRKTR